KELVENAMDAKADRIEVEIMAGGTSYMRVTDNGIGMSLEDAKLAIQRHATSKIYKVEDLLSIDTLGFRGEALPSISSVSRFTLQTRQAGTELGTEIKISGGREPEIGEAGCSLGTTIKVEDLFFNTPARKKFLKTTNTEGSKINDYIIKLAISRPDIAFKFINNNKTAVVTPGNGNLHDTLRSIYGNSLGDALLGVDFSDGETTVKGYISKPSTIRSNRNWQTFIVNGRIISNRAISKAVDNAYTALIPKAGFPMVALFMDVQPNTVDVNVHPQKSEIKFEDEGYIFKLVYKSVLDAVRPHGKELGTLAANVERPERHFTAPATTVNKPVMEPLIDDMHFVPATKPSIGTGYTNPAPSGLPSSAYQYRVEQQARTFHEAQTEMESLKEQEKKAVLVDNKVLVDMETGEVKEAAATVTSTGQSPMVPIGQVDDTYIIAQDADSLYIVDQHAAHERILYDRFAAMTDKIPSQQLLVHLFLDVSEREAQLIESNSELFDSLGFSMEQSGP
ncbi:MAG: DNA mismatch repair endonuclease MutL, partial [Anaerovibrio sp.]|nr:DNA mismatch repair endonuclease MutL [Anaerovibrio sp.]